MKLLKWPCNVKQPFWNKYGGLLFMIPSADWQYWILCQPKHSFRYQDQVIVAIMSKDNSESRFYVVAILKSNMAVHWLWHLVQIDAIGFLVPRTLHFDTRTQSIASLCFEIMANLDFKWRPFWNPIWRHIDYDTNWYNLISCLPKSTFQY